MIRLLGLEELAHGRLVRLKGCAINGVARACVSVVPSGCDGDIGCDSVIGATGDEAVVTRAVECALLLTPSSAPSAGR
ncbi:MAG: hypothetical protein R2838_04030 [Caldilineaceae bacterium]